MGIQPIDRYVVIGCYVCRIQPKVSIHFAAIFDTVYFSTMTVNLIPRSVAVARLKSTLCTTLAFSLSCAVREGDHWE